MSWSLYGTLQLLGGGTNVLTVPEGYATEGRLLVASCIGDTGSAPAGFSVVAAHGTQPARLLGKLAGASEPSTYTFSGLQARGSVVLLIYEQALLAGAVAGSWSADAVGSPAATVAPTAGASTIDSALLVSTHGVLNTGTVPNAAGPTFGGSPNLSGQAIRWDLYDSGDWLTHYGHCVVDASVTPIGSTTAMLIDWASGGIAPTDIGVGLQAVFRPVYASSTDAAGRFVDATYRGRFA